MLALMLPGIAAEAQVSFTGNAAAPVIDNPESSTGLSAVYVLSNTAGVTINYTAASASSTVKWMRFSNLGGGYAQDIPSTRVGNVSSVALTSDDMGYIVDEGDRRTCFWVVNYANHPCRLNSIAIAPEQDCLTAALTVDGTADRITYYTVNGVGRTLSRGLHLEYNTLTFNEETNTYDPSTASEEIEYLSSEIHVPAPLCSTEFLLTGDRFQQTWGGGKTVQTSTYQPRAVEAHTSATQTGRQVDNEQKDTSDGSSGLTLGGSAPVEILFEATATDGAIYHEWQFALDTAFDVIDMRVNDFVAQRVFTQYGTTYVRFVCGDDSGECTWTSETYVVNVGESRLECPNAFSPGSSEGSNDEWKVSYKSIVSFDCHIFNRWGVEVAHLTDPSQGWDGRYNGKLVKSGVFFYVIKAEGADGKSYNLSGDINILHLNTETGASSLQ